MKRRVRRKKKNRIVSCIILLVLLGIVLTAIFFGSRLARQKKTDELLKEYMGYITEQEYKKMYRMIDPASSGDISEEAFTERNSNIYEGIEVKDLSIHIVESSEGGRKVRYKCSFETLAGQISFENEADFVRVKSDYKLVWNDGMIFPGLKSSDKVRIHTTEAKRGQILDRDGRMLAGEGTASSVGIVPAKMEDRDKTVEKLSQLLDVDKEMIESKLSAKWVKDDSFVPIRTIPKVEELDLMSVEADEETLEGQKTQEELLEIPGIMISDTEVREYPLKEAAAHLIGYVQKVTAEDLKEHAGEGYHSNSVIGRSGVESLYEKDLKGSDGYEIYMEDENGDKKEVLAKTAVQNGTDIRLTIDSELQRSLYKKFREDKSCSVAMDPYSGEVLALVSTPSYDNNDFIMGMSDRLWEQLNADEKKPLYNRFRQVWCPGSTFKPIIGAIGMDCDAVDPEKDYGNEGLSWQKDESWGAYCVTTLHGYESATLKNALIYSDNIYFAKAALRIGAEHLVQSLKKLGFGEEVPFEIKMSASSYSNTDSIESEIQLADSGYGQGQVLVNPLHLTALYSAFSNEGNVLQPRLLYGEKEEPSIWMEQAFSKEAVKEILDGMRLVVNDLNGTGYGAHRDDLVLAGKTGTAEIKASKKDTTGTELGWFAVFTTDRDMENPVLLVSMVDGVKELGGSTYVVRKDKEILDQYLTK